MRDAISLQRANLLHPLVRREVIDTIEAIEAMLPVTAKIRIVQGLRTIAEQDAIYAQGRTKPGPIVTNAKGGSSYHNYGLAFDFAVMYDKDGNDSYEVLSWDINYDFDKDGAKDWQEVVVAFKAKGWKWGGDWTHKKDNPHLEKPFGYTWRELYAKYKAKDTLHDYVNIA